MSCSEVRCAGTPPSTRISQGWIAGALLAALMASFTFAPAAQAQSADGPPPHTQLSKAIGKPKADSSKPDVVPSLIVMNAEGATLKDDKLTLKGVASNSIVFADRPVRSAGHSLTSVLLDEWNPDYPDSFAADPPNATVSVFGASEEEIYDAVVTLKNPKMEGKDLTFEVAVLEGSLDGAEGPAALFIDVIGMPLTPLSYAGVARRTARRSAFYAAAAAPYYPPAPYAHPYPYPCGVYPYPTCP